MVYNSTFDMVAELRLTMTTTTERGNTLIDDNICDNDDEKKDNSTLLLLLHVHETRGNTIGLMGQMNIKLPTPTQFDVQNPQLNEWAEGVKAYITIHDY
eukprot:6487301-Amphidinium_carterae.1